MILSAQQPNFLPYAGFFERVALSDVFVVQDDVQYTKQDWQNRARIWSPGDVGQTRWLTVAVKGNGSSLISEKLLHHHDWDRRAWRIISAAYSLRPGNQQVRDLLTVGAEQGDRLAAVNVAMIREVCSILNIHTPILLASTLGLRPHTKPNERLIDLCRFFGVTEYLAGPGGANYLRLPLWSEAGVRVHSHRHEPARISPSRGPYLFGLSIVDSMLRDPNFKASFNSGLETARRSVYSAKPWQT